MNIAITGSRGLIGAAVTTRLIAAGHSVSPIERINSRLHKPQHALWWDPDQGAAQLDSVQPLDAVIHLGGEPIGAKRWTAETRSKIYTSRVFGTRGITEAINRLPSAPKSFICASAIGYYGDRGMSEIDESSPPGSGFLAKVCQDWEAEAQRVDSCPSIRLRTGIVLATGKGFLERLAPLFKFGLGGKLGPGTQYLSWIHIADHVSAVVALLSASEAEGPYNLVSPSPVTNTELTNALAGTFSRGTFLSVPQFAIELLMGKEMATETALTSQRVNPRRLTDELDFRFTYPELHDALRSLYPREK